MRNELKYEEKEKVGVGETLKLFEKIFGQKRDDVVLGRSHGVILLNITNLIKKSYDNY